MEPRQLDPQTLTHSSIHRRTALKYLLGAAGVLALSRFEPFTARGWADAPGANDLPDLSGFAKTPIATETLAEGIHVISGPGGNIGLFEGRDGALVIDSGLVERAKDLLATLRTLTDKPPRALVNSHWHYDHVGGNETFAQSGMRIVAQDNVRARVSARQHNDFFNSDIPPLAAPAWPVETFAQSLTLYVDDAPVQARHVPPAHTDGDSFVFHPKANVLHTGDLFFNGVYPFIDYSSGGSLEGMIAASDQILSVVDDATKIIPGHGPIGNKRSLRAFQDMLKTVAARLRPIQTLDEAIAARVTADLDETWGKGFFNGRQFIRVAFNSLKK